MSFALTWRSRLLFASASRCSRNISTIKIIKYRACQAMSSITVSNSHVNPKTEVSDAVRAAALYNGIILGNEEEELVQRLRKNWVLTAEDILQLSREEASELLLPIRLRTTIQALIRDGSTSLDVHAPTPTPTLATTPATPPSSPPTPLPSVSGEDVEPLPLQDQKCPRIYQNRGAGWKIKTTTRAKGSAYALTAEQISQTPLLSSEFKSFDRFCTTKFFGSQHDPICARTALNYSAAMRGILGWMHKERKVPLPELSMTTLDLPPPRRLDR